MGKKESSGQTWQKWNMSQKENMKPSKDRNQAKQKHTKPELKPDRSWQFTYVCFIDCVFI